MALVDIGIVAMSMITFDLASDSKRREHMLKIYMHFMVCFTNRGENLIDSICTN